jgi:eukaryotic-like serine/threonine-protein kinase
MSVQTTPPHDAEIQSLLDQALDDQKSSWARGEGARVERLLELAPALRDDAEALLDLIYQEYLLRKEAGEEPDPNELIARFPELAGPIMVQLGVDAAVPTTYKLPDGRNPPALTECVPTDPIGDHEILEILGRGGMGVVYKARDLKLGRLVAIKMMIEGRYADPERRDRFRSEAHAVARLRHPNIIAIYAIGEHEDRPYLSLEFAEGGSLARRLAEKPMAPREAAELLETLARAVNNAHQAGVVHRDLKPSNVLLTSEGIPKVSDFGLAKLLDSDSGRTITGQPLGTPSYMAPEQTDERSKHVGPETDVYGLGSILYQALTGRPPFLGGSPLETIRLVNSTEPVPPRQARPEVPKDLETICLKCLRKEPIKRYRGAMALAEDLRRFLEARPILARRATLPEQLVRWCRRNPWAAAFLVALVVGVIGLGAMAGVQARANQRLGQAKHATEVALEQSEESRKQAEAVGTFLVDAFRRPDPTQDGRQVRVADLLDQASAKLDRGFAGSQATKGALLDALGRTYGGLGLYEQAVMVHTQARDVRTAALGPEHFDTLQSCENLANAYGDAGRFPEAIALHQATLKILVAKLGLDHPETLKCRSNLAVAYADIGRLSEAIALHEEVLKVREATLGSDHPDTLGSRGNLAVAYTGAGRLPEAIALDKETLQLMEAKLGPDHPDTLVLRSNLALNYRDAGRISDAIGLDVATLKMREAKLGPEHPDTLKSRNNLALDYWAAGRFPEAIALQEPTLELLETRLGPDHPFTLMGRANLAALYEVVGRLSEAIALHEASLNLMQSKLGPDHPITLASRYNLANAHRLGGRLSEAIAQMEATIKRMNAIVGPDHPYTLESRANLAEAYESLGRWSDAELLLRDVLARRRRTDKSDSPLVAGGLAQLGENLLNQKRWSEAEPLLREALTIREKATPDAWERYEAMSLLGGWLLGQGRYDEAEPLIVRGYEGMKAGEERIPVPMRSRLLEAAIRVVQLYEARDKPQADAWKVKLGLPDLPADVFEPPSPLESVGVKH